MISAVEKRSIVIAGHKTSVALEPPFWRHFKRIARERGMRFGELAAQIAAAPRPANLSSCLRLFVLADLEAKAATAGAPSAGPTTPAHRAAAAHPPGPRRPLPVFVERA